MEAALAGANGHSASLRWIRTQLEGLPARVPNAIYYAWNEWQADQNYQDLTPDNPTRDEEILASYTVSDDAEEILIDGYRTFREAYSTLQAVDWQRTLDPRLVSLVEDHIGRRLRPTDDRASLPRAARIMIRIAGQAPEVLEQPVLLENMAIQLVNDGTDA